MSGVILYLSLTVASTRCFPGCDKKALPHLQMELPAHKETIFLAPIPGLMDLRRRKIAQKLECFINCINYFLTSTFLRSMGKQPQGRKSPVAADEEVHECHGMIPKSRGSVFLLHMGFALFPSCLMRHKSGKQDLGSVPLT